MAKKTKKKGVKNKTWERKTQLARESLYKKEEFVWAAFKLASEWFEEEGFLYVDNDGVTDKDARSGMIQTYATNLIRCHLGSLGYQDEE